MLPPERQRMLGIMLRELEQTLVPELQSAHAQTVAHLIDHGLRSLLVEGEAAAGATVAGHPGSTTTPDTALRHAIGAEARAHAARARAIAAVPLPQRDNAARDRLTLTPERLTAYFAARLRGAAGCHVSRVTPVLGGFSKQTALVDMTVDGRPMPLVIRRDIREGALTSTVVDEFPLLQALHGAGLPVPEPLLLEPGVQSFGAPFLVMPRAPGAPATHAMAGVRASAEQSVAARELATFLARLHRLDLSTLDLPARFFDPTLTIRDYLLREIDICEGYYLPHRLEPSPTIEATIAWLRANVPAVEGEPRCVHGDASLPNLMLDGDRLSVMLDWELAHPGDPVEDVTYARKWIDQVMPWDDFLAMYYAAGGVPYRPERERFYALLSDLRVGVFAVRARDMLCRAEHPDPTLMYAAQHYLGYFTMNMAENLLRD